MIEILKFEMINKGSLVARFNTKMHKWGGYVIKEWSLWESGEKKWVSAPSRQYEVDGKKKYAEYCHFEDRSMDDAFKAAIMKSVDEYMTKIAGNQTISHDKEDQIPF
jgi:hypothetical protein